MTEKATKKNVFVGREEEIETIKSVIKEEPKANILISGLTGMGKTELAIRIKELLNQDDLVHCGSHRVESKLEDPVNPFLVVLAEIFGSITTKETTKSKLKWFTNVFAKKTWEKRKDIGMAIVKDGLGTILKNVKEKVEIDDTTSTLTDILKDASSEWSTKSTLEKLLVENKEAVVTSYLRLLRQISDQSPNGHKFLLILDQVENTSEVFQEFLKSIARNLPDKFYLIFALNNEVPEGVDFLNEHKADLMYFKTNPVELEGLSNLEIRQLIEKTRDVYKTPDEVEKVRQSSDGRPLWIVQWINSKDFDNWVIEKEKLRLSGYYEENLTASGPEAKKLARVLSLLPFPLKQGLSDYAGIMEIDNSVCDEWLYRLESKNIFRKYQEGCWFSHGVIKNYISENMDEALKKEYVLQIINYLKRKYKQEIEAPRITDLKSVYTELLPFTDDYQTSFQQNHDLGMYHYSISSYHTAKEYFENALEAANRLKDQRKEGGSLNNIGEIYRAWGKYDQAIEYYKKSLKIFEDVGDRKGEGVTLNNIGLVYGAWGKYDQAIEYYKKSLKISEEVGGRQGEGVTLDNIGSVYYAWGKYDQAIEYYKKSLKIREEVGDRKGEGVTLNNIAQIYRARGKYDQAFEYYKKSLKIREEVGDRKGERVTLNNIGSVYYAWDKYDQALEYFKKSLKIFEDVGDRRNEGVTLNNIGEVYRAWSKYDQAIQYYKKSFKISEEVGDRQGEGVTLNNIAGVYYARGKYDQAIEYYERSLEIKEEVGDRQGEGVTLNNIGMVYDSWGKYDQAIEYISRSLNIFEEIGAAAEAKTVRENLKRVQEEMKKQ
jgi:tetratricopeptide (TPR) repeat protein